MPPDEKNDNQLSAAIDLLHGVKPAEATSAKADAAPAKNDAPAAAAPPSDAGQPGAAKPN